MGGNVKISIEVVVNASLEKAWHCFTSEDCITHWNFASPDWCCPRAKNDLRAGGKLLWRMEARDGSFGFDFEGIYTVVEPKKRIAYRLGDKRMVEIVFTQEKGKVRVAETFDPESENSLELQRNGWQAILDNFKLYTEKDMV